MKKLSIPVLGLLTCFVVSCNSADKKHDHAQAGGDKNIVDSLKESINDLHDKGMSKMFELTKFQQDTRRVLDSLNRLGNLQSPVVTYKASLDSLLKDLEYAEFAMDKWMPEYYGNTDTLSDNEDERIKYLENERSKATKITDAILGGIQKADSLLKVKL